MGTEEGDTMGTEEGGGGGVYFLSQVPALPFIGTQRMICLGSHSCCLDGEET